MKDSHTKKHIIDQFICLIVNILYIFYFIIKITNEKNNKNG